MYIRIAVKTSAFRFLWLKWVTGFNPLVHCAKCLEGRYAQEIAWRSQVPGMIYEWQTGGEGAPYGYLCGVTAKWETNLHVAFKPNPAERIEYSNPDADVLIVGAERILIETPSKYHFGLVISEEFHTCRNWQFGRQQFSDKDFGLLNGNPVGLHTPRFIRKLQEQ